MKILIIDDDQMLIDIWTIVLKKENFEILNAKTGKEGLELAKKEKPDFVMLDQIMPDMQGNDVLKALKDDPETSPIPVAIASNYSENEIMQSAIQNGAIDYILKYQIDPQDLVTKIKSLLQGSQPNPS